jgi:Cdc6-like AAA superfamily ATPase
MAAPRTQFYFPARAIDAALHATERAIRRAEGVALVVGQPGTGKSLLLAKVAEHVRDDFDVALLSGARILTRRALWQSILAEIGEPYRGIDEGELRMAVVDRIRGLAASWCSWTRGTRCPRGSSRNCDCSPTCPRRCRRCTS